MTAIDANDAMSRARTVALLRDYDRPGPRYTSYPTAVEFSATFDEQSYRQKLHEAARASQLPLSLYLHLPFCEERCLFCGCMVIITNKRGVAAQYLDYLQREIRALATELGDRRSLAQYHWGGGTPTYLSPDQIEQLHRTVAAEFTLQPGAEAAIEVDPRVTTREQIALLRQLGFTRLSMGVQDFAPDVQEAINRIQGERETIELYSYARQQGFTSINVDLIYGLPRQRLDSFAATIGSVASMRPDRIAVYSFAHVPWIRGNQRAIDESELPPPELKLELFAEARHQFLANGYVQIGMDHFALPTDELARASSAGTLHRNFMGYTVKPATDMVGVGVSAIGEVAGAFAQNVKKLSTYYEALDAGRFPIERGYALDQDDLIRRHVILGLMCNFTLDIPDTERRFGIDFGSYFRRELDELRTGPLADGLAAIDANHITIAGDGRMFVRNVSMIFDKHLRARNSQSPIFSRTV